MTNSGRNEGILAAENHRLAILRETGVGDATEIRVLFVYRNALEPGTAAECSLIDSQHVLGNIDRFQFASRKRPATDDEQPLWQLN